MKRSKFSVLTLLISVFITFPLTIVPTQAQDTRKDEAQKLFLQGMKQLYISSNPEGIEKFKQALVLYQQSGDLEEELRVLEALTLGYLYTLQDTSKALTYAQQRLIIAQKQKNLQFQIEALNALGSTYGVSGNYKAALVSFNQSWKLAPSQENSTALLGLGNTYTALGDYKKAIEIFHQIKSQRNESAYDIQADDGELEGEVYALSQMGNLPAAEKLLLKSLELKEKGWSLDREIRQVSDYLQGIAEAARAPNEPKYQQALQKYEQQIQDTLARFSQGIPSFREENNPDTNLAWADLYNATNFEKLGSTCALLQQVLIAQKKTTNALVIAERCRGRAFIERLAGRVSTNADQPLVTATVAPPTIAEMQQISKTHKVTLVNYWVTLAYQPFATRHQEAEILIWVIKPTGEVAFRRSNLKQSLAQLQPPKIAGKSRGAALVDLITKTRSGLGVVGRGDIIGKIDFRARHLLKQLHKLLIHPITDYLPKDPNAPVVFIPHESLFLVPFAALQDDRGSYLIQKHTILSTPSIQALVFTDQRSQQIKQNPQKNVLVVGNPTMPKYGEPAKQLPPLPAAEQEAVAIASLLKTRPLIGKQATETLVVDDMTKARVIHLATHGLLDGVSSSVNPLGRALSLLNLNYSSFSKDTQQQFFISPGVVALAPSSQDDGILTSDEIAKLKLNADLAVLSACNTGRGQITSDGVIGLLRAFLTAGVPNVVVSLWSVPDAPTADLMLEFYKNLLRNPNKAQALRQAMLTIMKKHPNPRDWSGFTLVGEAK